MPLESLPHACLILVHEFPKLPSISTPTHSLDSTLTRICLISAWCWYARAWKMVAFVPQFGFFSDPRSGFHSPSRGLYEGFLECDGHHSSQLCSHLVLPHCGVSFFFIIHTTTLWRKLFYQLTFIKRIKAVVYLIQPHINHTAATPMPF